MLNPEELLHKLNKPIRDEIRKEYYDILDKINIIMWSKMMKHSTKNDLEEVFTICYPELHDSFLEGMKLNPNVDDEYLNSIRMSIGRFTDD